LGESGEMTAGSTYNQDKYKLVFTSTGKIIEFVVKDKDGNEVEKKTIDFGSKIVY
jgi:K+/H+ antiporter YhaU regulatory subunit KhtT